VDPSVAHVNLSNPDVWSPILPQPQKRLETACRSTTKNSTTEPPLDRFTDDQFKVYKSLNSQPFPRILASLSRPLAPLQHAYKVCNTLAKSREESRPACEGFLGGRSKDDTESPGLSTANDVLVFKFPSGAVQFGAIGAETGNSG
jgi:hypothetical protein